MSVTQPFIEKSSVLVIVQCSPPFNKLVMYIGRACCRRASILGRKDSRDQVLCPKVLKHWCRLFTQFRATPPEISGPPLPFPEEIVEAYMERFLILWLRHLKCEELVARRGGYIRKSPSMKQGSSKAKESKEFTMLSFIL